LYSLSFGRGLGVRDLGLTHSLFNDFLHAILQTLESGMKMETGSQSVGLATLIPNPSHRGKGRRKIAS
jgi:hypothetical protein